jgi:D-3-phosphoglycerate dehydrogenase
MSRIVILSNLSRNLPGWDRFVEMVKNEGHEVVDAGEKDLEDAEALKHIKNADAAFVGLNRLSGNVIRSGDSLKVIAKPGIGVDNIDVSAATREGIIVCNTPGSNAESVADHLFGLMIALLRRIPYLDSITRAGKGWQNYPPVVAPEISAKKLGVIGTGHIGKAVIRRAKGFNMEILACDKIEDGQLTEDFSVRYLPLKDVLGNSDLVTLHISLIDETRGLIGEKELRLMKRNAYLFNTSRGAIVDQKALIKALKEKQIAGAGLDVFEEEPLLKSELFELENVVLTPHVAGYSPEASIRSRIMSAENIINAFRGIEPHIVNLEVLSLPQRRIQFQKS